ncbi:hypothetical protein CP10139811_0827 [Chlamydia ibidis]|uniref:Uncharacterized protein n=2 Tax=Chlamydia ibidis TaxID=1405396 RepID=S7KEK2_9CHLA|nr:hypothetical protein [Chlamydia ibidis]EPP34621.1 hypothetical protein CP10139811_0827 [Chlamydia ibidis]EQM63074.1 hypothetical protein H359_0146 [Chlamydia ibidis 10-1398/6]
MKIIVIFSLGLLWAPLVVNEMGDPWLNDGIESFAHSVGICFFNESIPCEEIIEPIIERFDDCVRRV